MKYLYCFLILIVFLSCSDEKIYNSSQNEINFYIKTAEDSDKSFDIRKQNNLKAEKAILSVENDSLCGKYLCKIAYNYSQIYQWNDLKRIAAKLLKNARVRNDSLYMAQSYKFLGLYYQNLSINDSAFKFFIKAEKIFKNKKERISLCEIYYEKAVIQYYINDYQWSDQSLIQSLKISKEFKLYYIECKIYELLALNSLILKDYNEALEYNLKSLKAYKSLKKRNKYLKAQIFANIGYNYIKLEKFHKAIKFLQEGLKEKNLLTRDPQTYSYITDNLAHANFKLKNYSQLPQLYLQAAKIRDSLNIEQGQNYNRLYLSEYYAAMKDTVKSSYYAHEAFALSKKFKAPVDMLQVLKQLSKIEPQHALKYSNDYIRISDSVYQLERETRNKFAKIAYETEEITNEKNTALTQKSIFSSIALAIFVFGFLIFIIIHQKNKHKEMYFVQQQQKNNEEIYQLIQLQHHKVEEARLVEKQRIAQDLHDGIMNKLASTRFNLHLLTKKNNEDTFSKCAPYIDGIQDIEKEIRNIAHDLNNQVFAKNSSFKNTLITLFDEQKEIIKAKFHIEFSNEINWELLKGNIKIHIFRIFQELLQNISKHAAANNVIVSAAIKKEVLFLEVYDDGEGFSLKGKKKGIGLQNIYARVKECGGTIKILSNKGQGTKVIIKIPIQKKIKIV